ncbi:hypothetical protein PFISCL1PPCAC_4142, partial [Pristionchus fissidentatus]
AFLSSMGFTDMEQKDIKLEKRIGDTIPDGTLLTFLFRNKNNDDDPRVQICLMNDDANYANITIAYWGEFVYHGNVTNGNASKEAYNPILYIDRYNSYLDWWTVDLHKVSRYHMNVCVIGYCFKKPLVFAISLDGIKTIRIFSGGIYFDDLLFSMQRPDRNILH